MSISVTGLGSGLNYDSWITQLVAAKQTKIDDVSKQVTDVGTQKTTLSSVQSSYKSLLASIETFTNALSGNDAFNQKSVTSSSDAVKAAVTAGADVQNLSITVSQLATATTAQSSSSVASYVKGSTTISNVSEGAIKAGTFSVYVNGTKNSINIASSDTLDGVLTKLNSIDGVNATLSNDGKLSIAAKDSGYSVSVGSSSDTSNFSKAMSLTRNVDTGVYSSSKSIFDTNSSSALVSGNFAKGTITAGNFTIGDTSFTVKSDTTLDGIISQINQSKCGATAAWDPNSGKLVLTATDEGAVNLNITAGDGTVGNTDASNFTDIMGLTNSTWDTDGKLATTALTNNSQNLGTNAILSINGTTITSSSNTVTSDISGVTGLTLTLNNKTSSSANVSIAQDTSKTIDAITSLVSAFNMAISSTDDATGTNGKLHGESVLSSLRNTVRKTATASIGGDGLYKTLASIGISTGAFSTDTSADTNKLNIDTTALKAALTANPDAVKKLLVGDGTTEGVLTKMAPSIDNALDPVKGYFTKRTASLTKESSTLSDKVSTMTKNLDSYKTQLETKFAAMDKMISSLKSQATLFDSYFNKSSSSSSSSSSS